MAGGADGHGDRAGEARSAGRSAVLPYRGGKDESGLLAGFVQAVLRSDIDELVVGVDDDADSYPEVARARRRHGDRLRVVQVPPSPDWGFRFAAVLWHLIQCAKHDLVLVTNVDEIPSGMALERPRRAGRSEHYVLESGFDTADDEVNLPGWTGTFWLWRPSLEKYVDVGDYKRIRDGGDSFFFWSAIGAGLRYHSRHGRWITLRRKPHSELYWFRWKSGLRECALGYRREGSPPGLARRMVRAAKVSWSIAAGRGDRWYHAGWLAGLLRPRAYWTTAAQGMGYFEWAWQGSLPYEDLCKRWWRSRPSMPAYRMATYPSVNIPT